ncbi:hypothetical protein [Butyrivibrio sp. WCE2006]|uniref:hypothetical protein n=1 Tax=Butyrivibrio sp. WCE2006 TaxID=1410611 RepID=UPI0005D27F34|nr:hypothetical protein [Butyrivibrio sp. WCE2006]
MTSEVKDFKEEMDKALDLARWQGEISGKVEGAMNVLFALDIDMEKRIELLQDAVGLSHITASEFIEPRQIEENIYKNEKLSYDKKESLYKLMTNKAMNDEKKLEHPLEMFEFLSTMADDCILDECKQQVKKWVKSREDVSMRKIKDWLINKYKLL